jgi:hypothetical protein
MTYRAQFLYSDLPEYIQIGGEHPTVMDAVRLCYDLKNRQPYIQDYRVVSSEGQIVFSRGKQLPPEPVLGN